MLPVIFEGGPHDGMVQALDILPSTLRHGPAVYQRACVISAKRHVYRYIPQTDGERPPQSAAPHRS